MWCRIENNSIKRYSAIPECWKNYIGFHMLGEDIHKQEGFFPLEPVYFDVDIEQTGDLYFDEQAQVFRTSIIAKELPSVEDAKAQKISQLKSEVKELYNAVQWYISSKQIAGETIPTAVKDKIKLVRTKFYLIKAEINALQTVVEVLKYQLPHEQIQNLRDQLEAIE
jgi:hypothetical protein